MISGRDIVLISSVEWGFLWQVPQEVSLRLARAGNRVLYVENTGIRSPSLRDAARIMQRLRRWADSLPSRGARGAAEGVQVVSPLVLPPFGPGWRRSANRRLLEAQVARAARRLGMRDPIVWAFLPTDTAADIIRLLSTPRGVVVYHCAADFSQLTPHARALACSEEELLKASDVVFATCSSLARLCGRWNANVHVLPPGVDLDAFPPEGAGGPGAGGGAGPGSPVIGYVGGLHRHVDYELLKGMARARPEWSWVFVGPLQTEVNGLGSLPNVRLLGERPHDELARHIRGMDVCLVPYLNNEATATVVPVKVNEYLAAGKPVVTTPLPTMREFNECHDILFTAEGREETFLRAIESALPTASDERMVERRRRVAALNDWGTRLEIMSDLIEEAARRKGRGGRARAAGGAR